MAAVQRRLTMHGVDYPKRDGHFLHRYIRMLGRQAIANLIGPDGCWLLTIIAMTEDAKRYKAAPTFWDDQLVAYFGTSQKTLARVRRKCVEAGLLHIERGSNRKVGTYWVVMPDRFKELADSPLGDEGLRTDLRQSCRNGGTNPAAIVPQTCPRSIPIPKTSSPPPEEIEVVVEEIRDETRKSGDLLGKAAETVAVAISNGLTLRAIREVLAYWSNRSDLGSGMLRHRLIAKDAAALTPDEGWPAPSVAETQRQEMAARLERATKEAAERDARSASSRDAKAEQRQLELKFGTALDALPNDQKLALVADQPYLVKLLRRRGGGPTSPIRVELLRAFAAERN